MSASSVAGEPGLHTEIAEQARRARAAAAELACLPGTVKARVLEAAAGGIECACGEILAANRKDCVAAEEAGLASALIDRLRLDDRRVGAMAAAVREVAALPDPVGEISESWVRPNGLRVSRIRIPLGVIAMIYESRPNVTSDAAALCFKSGNAVVLRGGSEAFQSNEAIGNAMRAALERSGVTPDAIQLIGSTDRDAIRALLQMEAEIDLVIPRGGESLIRAVTATSRIPVLKHYKGVCHVYVDDGADVAVAADIVFNAKVQRPSVCNAAETLLVHAGAAADALPAIARRLWEAGVEIRGCERTRELLGDRVRAATEEDWHAEYLDLTLSVAVVSDMDDAIAHISKYGTDHTEAIVTRDCARARRFVSEVQSSTVLVNASTRFADGGELGLGAEIGISTSKLHAFGPMGARELTTTKFVVFGDGQVRD